MTEEQGEAVATPPEPSKKKPATMTVYNASRTGQKITIKQGVTIPPGQSGRVPYALGKKLVDRVHWIKRAERGDPMDY